MPSPRPPGSGVEKILVPYEILQDHVLHFVIFPCCCTQPGVRLFTCCPRFFILLGCSSPGLSLFALRAPLLLPSGCPAITSEMSHFVTIITLHLGGITAPFPLNLVVSIPWRERGFLVLLVSQRRFVFSQCKSSLCARSGRRVHRIWVGYGWTRRCKEPAQVVWFRGSSPKSFQDVASLFDGLHMQPLFLPFDGHLPPSFVCFGVVKLIDGFV